MDTNKMEKIIICPRCQGKIEIHDMFITCGKCKLAYPIVDDVPDMLIEDAWKLDKAKKAKFKHELHI